VDAEAAVRLVAAQPDKSGSSTSPEVFLMAIILMMVSRVRRSLSEQYHIRLEGPIR